MSRPLLKLSLEADAAHTRGLIVFFFCVSKLRPVRIFHVLNAGERGRDNKQDTAVTVSIAYEKRAGIHERSRRTVLGQLIVNVLGETVGKRIRVFFISLRLLHINKKGAKLV